MAINRLSSRMELTRIKTIHICANVSRDLVRIGVMHVVLVHELVYEAKVHIVAPIKEF